MIGAANAALEEMRPPEAFVFSLYQPDHLILVAGNELTHLATKYSPGIACSRRDNSRNRDQ